MSNDRLSFSIKRKKWCLQRDKTCQAPFKHECDGGLQVHHILPHAYLNRVAPDISADFPENFITVCQNAHEIIHPDVLWARMNYHKDTNTFQILRSQRNIQMDNHQIYWNDTWDRSMNVMALINTRKFKNPFPGYKRRKCEKFTDSEDEGL